MCGLVEVYVKFDFLNPVFFKGILSKKLYNWD